MTYEVGQKLTGGVASLRASETSPPERFTDGQLIAAMINVHRFVPADNEADRKILKNTEGIGTERTRDGMIETLIARKYVKVVKGKLHPTDFGMELIQKLPRELSDPVTTAKWEALLGMIERGEITKDKFDKMIRKMATELVEKMKGVEFDLSLIGAKPREEKAPQQVDDSLPGHGLKCERCKRGTMIGKRLASGKKVVSCNNFPACKNTNWINE